MENKKIKEVLPIYKTLSPPPPEVKLHYITINLFTKTLFLTMSKDN